MAKSGRIYDDISFANGKIFFYMEAFVFCSHISNSFVILRKKY